MKYPATDESLFFHLLWVTRYHGMTLSTMKKKDGKSGNEWSNKSKSHLGQSISFLMLYGTNQGGGFSGGFRNGVSILDSTKHVIFPNTARWYLYNSSGTANLQSNKNSIRTNRLNARFIISYQCYMN